MERSLRGKNPAVVIARNFTPCHREPSFPPHLSSRGHYEMPVAIHCDPIREALLCEEYANGGGDVDDRATQVSQFASFRVDPVGGHGVGVSPCS